MKESGAVLETELPQDSSDDSAVVRAAVAGATGYAGRELIALLSHHPRARVTQLMSSGRAERQPFPIENSHPSLRGVDRLLCQPFSIDALSKTEADVVFLCTPHETSHEAVPVLLDRGLRVVDLSGAFRLKDAGAFARWYGFEHHAALALNEAVYGLTELNAAEIEKARLVANPGCYATSIILALAPLLRAGWVDISAGIVCDSKSGASGAGRAPTDKLHFAEVNENCRAYGLFTHRHVPEMLQALSLAEKDFTFTPHLLPITRGILSTIYTRLASAAQVQGPDDIAALYQDFYSNSPLVRVLEDGKLPEIQAVSHTNYTDIGFALDTATRRLIVVSSLDNLGKGAAGQAVQNMNLMFGLPQEMGLG